MSEEQKGFWSTVPGILTAVSGLIVALTGLYLALKPAPPHIEAPSPGGPVSPPPQPPKKYVMGALQPGVNYNHGDLHVPFGDSTTTAEACADLCNNTKECFAMTYVIPLRTCWIKREADNRVADPVMVSSVKLEVH